MRNLLLAAACVALATGCSPPASKGPGGPEAPSLTVACNDLAPDAARQIALQDEVAVAAAVADLRGGRITPGTYDLVSGNRIGAATGWQGTRAVALDVREDESGAVINWASLAPGSEAERWSAGFMDAPTPHLTFTCGRSGGSDLAFTAELDELRLRMPEEGGTGSLYLVFARRT